MSDMHIAGKIKVSDLKDTIHIIDDTFETFWTDGKYIYAIPIQKEEDDTFDELTFYRGTNYETVDGEKIMVNSDIFKPNVIE